MNEYNAFLKLLEKECMKGKRIIPIPHDYAMCILAEVKELQEEIERQSKAQVILDDEIAEANESITWWQNRYNAVERDRKQLENNRDKAIKYLEEKADYPISYYHCIRETIDILKGNTYEEN